MASLRVRKPSTGKRATMVIDPGRGAEARDVPALPVPGHAGNATWIRRTIAEAVMKPLHRIALGAAVAAIAGSALATGTGSLNEFPRKILPVLVHVDAQGKVTDASPAMRLPPALERLLLANLNERITGPAIVHGKPVPSQFVMNLALVTTPRPGGDFDANFAYVSTSPVPPGSWYWVHIDGHRLALANRNAPAARQIRPMRPIADPPVERTLRPPYRVVAPATPAMRNGTVGGPERLDIN